MAASEYRVWADISNPDTDQAGTLVATQVTASVSGALYWYLEKAGIKTGGDGDLPTTGQIYPR